MHNGNRSHRVFVSESSTIHCFRLHECIIIIFIIIIIFFIVIIIIITCIMDPVRHQLPDGESRQAPVLWRDHQGVAGAEEGKRRRRAHPDRSVPHRPRPAHVPQKAASVARPRHRSAARLLQPNLRPDAAAISGEDVRQHDWATRGRPTDVRDAHRKRVHEYPPAGLNRRPPLAAHLLAQRGVRAQDTDRHCGCRSGSGAALTLRLKFGPFI